MLALLREVEQGLAVALKAGVSDKQVQRWEAYLADFAARAATDSMESGLTEEVVNCLRSWGRPAETTPKLAAEPRTTGKAAAASTTQSRPDGCRYSADRESVEADVRGATGGVAAREPAAGAGARGISELLEDNQVGLGRRWRFKNSCVLNNVPLDP